MCLYSERAKKSISDNILSFEMILIKQNFYYIYIFVNIEEQRRRRRRKTQKKKQRKTLQFKQDNEK